MTTVTTTATYKTKITADLPDWPSSDVTFQLVADFFTGSGEEVLAGKTYTMTLSATGNDDDAFYLPTPDNTGATAVNWRLTLPSGYEATVTVGYNASAQSVADLIAAGATTTDPDTIVAALASKATKASGATAGNLASLTSGGDLADSGAAAANVPTGDEKAWLTAGEAGGALGSAAYAATGDFDAAGSAAAAQAYAIQRANHTGTQTLSTISDAGTMAAQATTNYYAKTDFSAAPTAAEPLKANGAGNVTLATHLYLGDSTMYFSKSGTNIIAKTPSGLYFRDSNNYDRIFFSTVTTRFRSPNNAKYINVTNGGLGVNVESPGGLFHVQGAGGAEVAMILQTGTAPTANALEMRDSGGTVQASFAKNFAWTPPQLADSAAANGTVYYSTDVEKLVFKDLAGIVNALY